MKIVLHVIAYQNTKALSTRLACLACLSRGFVARVAGQKHENLLAGYAYAWGNDRFFRLIPNELRMYRTEILIYLEVEITQTSQILKLTQNSRDDKLEIQIMSALWRNRNNRVVVSSEKIELDVGRDDEIMAVVDHFICLFKRLLTCYEISRRRGKLICGTLVVLSCGFCDPGECFVTKPNCFEKIDFFCQIWKELNNTFESTQTDKKKWKVSIKIGATF